MNVKKFIVKTRLNIKLDFFFFTHNPILFHTKERLVTINKHESK